MSTRSISIALIVALSGCEGRPKAAAHESPSPGQPAGTTPQWNAPRHPWNIGALGLRSTEFLLPYVGNCTADGGSHRWICEVSPNGDILREILFVIPRSDQTIRFEVYCVTYPNGLEERRRLSQSEVEHEIRQIESKIAASGAKEQYDYFYAGGELIDEANSEDGNNDPFGGRIPDGIDHDSEDAKRKMAEAVNRHTLSFIADLVGSYRSTIRHAADGQPATN